MDEFFEEYKFLQFYVAACFENIIFVYGKENGQINNESKNLKKV